MVVLLATNVLNLTDGIQIMVANDDQKQQQQKFMKTPSAATGFVGLQMDGFHLTLHVMGDESCFRILF